MRKNQQFRIAIFKDGQEKQIRAESEALFFQNIM